MTQHCCEKYFCNQFHSKNLIRTNQIMANEIHLGKKNQSPPSNLLFVIALKLPLKGFHILRVFPIHIAEQYLKMPPSPYFK